MVKQKVYPKPHDIHYNFQLSADDTDFNNQATFIPVLYNDDAMTASTYYANPQHASFAEGTQSGCYPESKVFNVSARISMQLMEDAWMTDLLRQLEVVVIPVSTAFLEDLTPKDDLTGETIESILELQHETTDRQVYPIYNGTKLGGNVLELGSNQLGLTTNTNIEGIDFDLQKLYDSMSYYTIKGKVKSVIGGVMRKTLAMPDKKTKPGANINLKIRLPKGAKAMNPYTFFGFIIYIPKLGLEQVGEPTRTSDTDHVQVDVRIRFNEWNDSFNFERA